MAAGQIIILNGASRSGKSSIAAAIQEMFDNVWVNLGVDACAQITPRDCARRLAGPPALFLGVRRSRWSCKDAPPARQTELT